MFFLYIYACRAQLLLSGLVAQWLSGFYRIGLNLKEQVEVAGHVADVTCKSGKKDHKHFTKGIKDRERV